MPAAPRATWSGSISFGLVSVPVGFTSAVSEKKVSFNQFHEVAGEFNPVGRNMVDKVTGEILETAEITRGYKTPSGVVTVTDEELDALKPESTKVVQIEKFVDATQVDPLYFAKHEYAMPKSGGEQAYLLLATALVRTGKAGIGHLVIRSKEHIVMVRAVLGPDSPGLVVTYLNYQDELRSIGDLALPGGAVNEPFVDQAVVLINALSGDFDPSDYEDTQRNRVLELIAEKAAGKPVQLPTQPTVKSAGVSLMDALNASIEAAQPAKPAKKAPAKRARKAVAQ